MLTRHTVGRRMGSNAYPLLVYGGDFVIGWKCRVGYVIMDDEPTTTDAITSLNQITFIENSLLVFPTDVSEFIDKIWPSTVSMQEVSAYLENTFYTDFYSLYSFPYTNYYSDDTNFVLLDSIVDTIIPSTFLHCPSTKQWFDTNYPLLVASQKRFFYLFIEIPSLNRGILCSKGFTNRLYRLSTVYEINGNNITYLLTNNNEIIPKCMRYMQDVSKGTFNITWTQFWVNKLGPYNDISKWGWVTAQYKNDGASCVWNSYSSLSGNSKTQMINYLNAIFGDSSSPDFVDNLPPPPDPMEPIGPSGPGGGNGNFDNDSDIIEDSSLPTLSAADTGFTRIYSPTLSQVQALARYLWTDETVIETIWNKIKQIFENPMDAIIAFNLVPVPVEISGTKNFALMYIDTGVSMNTVQNQFVDVDCGTFEIKEYYGSALDYSPNTKISCFLPFIGVVTLNTDEVMNTTLQVKYRVDIVSGSCVAKVFVNGSVLYQFSGHCSIPIPFTASDYSSYLSAAIGVAKLAIGAAVGGGAGAAAAGASEIDVEQATHGIDFSSMSADESVSTTMAAMDEARSKNTTAASYKGIASQNITNVVGTVMGAKLHVEHSGSFSGNTGYLGVRRPYLIIQRPRMCMPNEYRKFNGYPSMITLNIGDCKGYTKVQQIQLQGVSATNPEQSEILQLLKGGIII